MADQNSTQAQTSAASASDQAKLLDLRGDQEALAVFEEEHAELFREHRALQRAALQVGCAAAACQEVSPAADLLDGWVRRVNGSCTECGDHSYSEGPFCREHRTMGVMCDRCEGGMVFHNTSHGFSVI